VPQINTARRVFAQPTCQPDVEKGRNQFFCRWPDVPTERTQPPQNTRSSKGRFLLLHSGGALRGTAADHARLGSAFGGCARAQQRVRAGIPGKGPR